jgi:hypothetical protein
MWHMYTLVVVLNVQHIQETIYCCSDPMHSFSRLLPKWLRNSLQNRTTVRVFTHTMRKGLHDAGMNTRRPVICVSLTNNNI